MYYPSHLRGNGQRGESSCFGTPGFRPCSSGYITVFDSKEMYILVRNIHTQTVIMLFSVDLFSKAHGFLTVNRFAPSMPTTMQKIDRFFIFFSNLITYSLTNENVNLLNSNQLSMSMITTCCNSFPKDFSPLNIINQTNYIFEKNKKQNKTKQNKAKKKQKNNQDASFQSNLCIHTASSSALINNNHAIYLPFIIAEMLQYASRSVPCNTS